MVQYSADFKRRASAKSARAKVSDLTCHFKNTWETARALTHGKGRQNNMTLKAAQQYLRQVLAKTRAIPFRRYENKTGRCAQAKNELAGSTKGRWPRKSVVAMLNLLKNAESNAVHKGLDANKLIVTNVSVNQAARRRRRTYRAHGRAGPYMRSPCHVQVGLAERTARVPKPTSAPKQSASARNID